MPFFGQQRNSPPASTTVSYRPVCRHAPGHNHSWLARHSRDTEDIPLGISPLLAFGCATCIDEASEVMHTGEQYHQFFLTSRRDVVVRSRFQRMAMDLLPRGADVLDFGAGTGIDARTYASHGHRTFVYEPTESMRDYLLKYCGDELEQRTIVAIDSLENCKVSAVTANFAVLNHFADHTGLFEDLAKVVPSGGFVLASMLNPFYLGDARYGWWLANIVHLLRRGHYAIRSESRIHRFAPRVVAQAAAPYFRLEQRVPAGWGMATQLYMFLLFRRN